MKFIEQQYIADEDLWVETFYSKDLMLLLLNKLHISLFICAHVFSTTFTDCQVDDSCTVAELIKMIAAKIGTYVCSVFSTLYAYTGTGTCIY